MQYRCSFSFLELVDVFLVDDRVDGHGGLARLTVADDQLTLAAADGNQRVDGLEARLHRFVNRFTRDNAGRFHFDAAGFFRLDRTFAVDRIAQTINNAAEQFFTNRNFHDLAGTLDDVAFFDVAVVAENNDPDIVGLRGSAPCL
jgi:hypothetical protein